MSVDIAIIKIAEYTAAYDTVSQQVSDLQSKLDALQVDKPMGDEAKEDYRRAVADCRKKLAVASLKQGLYKEFIEFWKGVLQQFLSMVKSLQELAQGAR